MNTIQAAYEGGMRLERRNENVLTSFTYGKKLKYAKLDDTKWKEKCIKSFIKKPSLFSKFKKGGSLNTILQAMLQLKNRHT